jgi:hypothetical protein
VASTVQTTAGEVLKACEVALGRYRKETEETRREIEEEYQRRLDEFNASRQRDNERFKRSVAEWESRPFWKRWFGFESKPEIMWIPGMYRRAPERPFGILGSELDTGRIERLRDGLRWLDPSRTVMLDVDDARIIGLGEVKEEAHG